MTDENKALAVAGETLVTTAIPLAPEIVRSLVLDGDLSKLTPDQRLAYYLHRCNELGIDPSEQPFRLLRLSGRLVLYAQKGCTDAICRNSGITREITKRERIGDIFVVTARATDRSGRYDESTGAVPVTNLKGADLANAYMKAETKAKRRAVISLCGINTLDESELDTVPGARTMPIDAPSTEATTDPMTDLRFRFGKILRERKAEIVEANLPYESGDWKLIAARAAAIDEWPDLPDSDTYEAAVAGLESMTLAELLPPDDYDPGDYDPGDGGDIDEIDPDEDRKTT